MTIVDDLYVGAKKIVSWLFWGYRSRLRNVQARYCVMMTWWSSLSNNMQISNGKVYYRFCMMGTDLIALLQIRTIKSFPKIHMSSTFLVDQCGKFNIISNMYLTNTFLLYSMMVICEVFIASITLWRRKVYVITLDWLTFLKNVLGIPGTLEGPRGNRNATTITLWRTTSLCCHTKLNWRTFLKNLGHSKTLEGLRRNYSPTLLQLLDLLFAFRL